MAFRPRDILPLYQAVKVGVIVVQFKGSAPAASVGVDGAVAIDSKDGKRYVKAAGAWTASPL